MANNVDFTSRLASTSSVVGQTQSPKQPIFSQSIEAAKKLFKESGLSNKTELEGLLFKAYNNIDESVWNSEPHFNEIHWIFYLYGRCKYGGDMEAARKFLSIALLFHCTRLGLHDKNLASTYIGYCKSMDSIVTSEIVGVYNAETILKISSDQILRRIRESGGEEAFPIASTLRWLGHCYQNIDRYKKIKPDDETVTFVVAPHTIYVNVDGVGEIKVEVREVPISKKIVRFGAIYGTAKNLLQYIVEHSKDPLMIREANWELGQLEYNTGRFLYLLCDPEDIEGSLKTLDKLIPYLDKEGATPRSVGLEAQILNILALTYRNLAEKPENVLRKDDLIKRALENVRKAVELVDKTPDFPEPFLQHNFYNNFVSGSLILNKTNYEELDVYMQKALAYAKSQNYDHNYFAIWLMTAASLASKQDKQQLVESYLKIADEIVWRFADSSKDIAKDLREVKSKLLSGTRL